MNRPLALTALALALVASGCDGKSRSKNEPAPVAATKDAGARTRGAQMLVIHGGAGAIRRHNMTPELEAEYRGVLTSALQAGYEILSAGGSSEDAVEAVIVLMEDSPLFNAGIGAVFTNKGTHELDASIMLGDGMQAGAVAAVTRTKNPIRAARAVMEHSPHVLLSGAGADAFAAGRGLEQVDPTYFDTPRRREQLERELEKERIELDHGGADAGSKQGARNRSDADKYGTVGAAAVDSKGRLSAGTSTGGMTNKRHGRVGDSPIIGAGTYADDRVAVSCTGHGEFFIRYAVAHEVAARVRLSGVSLSEAAETVISELEQVGGSGGLIAIDRDGNVAWPFNTPGMYRGQVDASGETRVEIYR